MLARKFFTFTAAAVLATVAGATVAAGPAQAAATSKVSVVHGIPGVPVDVYVNGTKTLSNFQPATVAGPLDLAAGKYDIVLTKPGDPVTTPILKVDQAAVPAGANLSLVAHLTADGKPTLTAFSNDVSMIATGKTRLIVRHVAAAPAVDVRAGGTPVIKNLTNPHEAKLDLAAGTVNADVVLAGTSTVAIGPAALTLAEGTVTIVYATGSATDKTLALVSQKITGMNSAPGGVPSGTGGHADQGVGWWAYAVAALGLLLVGGSLWTVRSRRRLTGARG
jgi:hypothetical protein